MTRHTVHATLEVPISTPTVPNDIAGSCGDEATCPRYAVDVGIRQPADIAGPTS